MTLNQRGTMLFVFHVAPGHRKGHRKLGGPAAPVVLSRTCFTTSLVMAESIMRWGGRGGTPVIAALSCKSSEADSRKHLRSKDKVKGQAVRLYDACA